MSHARVTPIALGFISLALLQACSSTPELREAPELPELEAEVEYFAGSALEGPRVAAMRMRSEETLPCARIRLRCFEFAPETKLDAISSHTRLVLAARGDEPILPSTRLLGSTRIARGDEARAFLKTCEANPLVALSAAAERASRFPRSERVVDELVLVPRGVTASLSAFSDREFDVVGEGKLRKRLRLQLARAQRDGALDLTLVLEDRSEESSTSSAISGASASEESLANLRREILVLDRALNAGDGPLVLVLPAPLHASAHAWAVSVEVSERPAAELVDELAACIERVASSTASAQRALQAPEPRDLRRKQLGAAVDALKGGENTRAVLRWLARDASRPLLAELALALEGEELAAVGAALSSLDLPKIDEAALSWALERRCWEHLVVCAQEGRLAPVLDSILLAQAGELARYPSTLASFAKRSKSDPEMRARIIAENLLMLEDGNPASRVRAYDWLASRALAPEDFDPLGPEDARRRALEAAAAKKAAEAAAAKGEGVGS